MEEVLGPRRALLKARLALSWLDGERKAFDDGTPFLLLSRASGIGGGLSPFNAAAAKLAKSDKEPDDQLHAMDYMVYAYLQLGRDRASRLLIEEVNTISGDNADRNTTQSACR